MPSFIGTVGCAKAGVADRVDDGRLWADSPPGLATMHGAMRENKLRAQHASQQNCVDVIMPRPMRAVSDFESASAAAPI